MKILIFEAKNIKNLSHDERFCWFKWYQKFCRTEIFWNFSVFSQKSAALAWKFSGIAVISSVSNITDWVSDYRSGSRGIELSWRWYRKSGNAGKWRNGKIEHRFRKSGKKRKNLESKTSLSRYYIYRTQHSIRMA